MPVKIELFAENIAVGSSVVEFALSQGCGLKRYEEVDSAPIKAPPKDVPMRQTEDSLVLVTLESQSPFQKNSIRDKAWEVMRKANVNGQELTRRALYDLLMKKLKLEPRQMPSVFRGLEDYEVIQITNRTIHG